ncbi:Acetyltransferase (GNAT) family protein [Babesia bovis T2Bo]|uniref:N-acetyltransferase domain-containing protein n=1 Tax=Babesia bovis TaxID=5865 RepID=A7ASG5_BABBO|nr:Acetyltransferase (GNAT) family protein [Babesia bovis T2Bo]EDO07484.1 Acetyltransferase (GNAT) family protein [Babesia bovis T2Bo]BAN64237.1 conserved hypothetical protein [Babesia bovis]|eukprot:XP_001611052.1 hypothetical protein [Babesia bovis T2Bo]
METRGENVGIFDRHSGICEEFELDGLCLKFKQLESYDEYLEVRPLVEQLSRCSIIHYREYVERMLRYPSYYPFVLCLSGSASNVEPRNPVGDNTDANTSTAECNSSLGRNMIIGYLEIYVMPHLGRSFDCRLERVVIHPSYRNRGICQRMLNSAIEFCTSVLRCNRIDLISDNPVAVHIYKKFGFDHVMVNTYRKSV